MQAEATAERHGPPASFLPATWRGTIPPSGVPPRMGVSFDRPDGTVHVLMLS